MSVQPKTEPVTEAPVTPGDRMLLSYPMTAIPEPTWAVVDFVQWVLAEEILRGNTQTPPWKVGYRITLIDPSGHALEQLGVAFLGDDGHDMDGFVLDIDRATTN